MGTGLLKLLSRLNPETEELQRELLAGKKSAEEEFRQITGFLRGQAFRMDTEKANWEGLRGFLTGKRDFLLRLLENPYLLEHESFTDLLWAVFHLSEELGAREDLQGLPPEDHSHLDGDMARVYRQLALQWLAYMEHLKEAYPFLFSLEIRTNPFNRSASPVVRA